MRCASWVCVLAACTSGTGDPTKSDPDPDPVDGDTDTDIDTDADSDADTDPSTTVTEPCENEVVTWSPEAGDTDAYYRGVIRATLAVAEPGATITVRDADGTEVPGVSTVDGTEIRWSGDPLSPSSAYEAVLHWSCPSVVTSFTTSDVGSPTTVDPSGRTYTFDVAQAHWTAPSNIGDLLASFLGGTQVLGTVDVRASRVDWLGTFGEDGVQDLCTPTLAMSSADWDDPYYEIGPEDATLELAGVAIALQQLEMTGAFSPDADRIQGGTLRAAIDTRDLVDLVSPGGGDDAVCVLVGALGVGCVPCVDGDLLCLELALDGLEAPHLRGVTVEERTPRDVETDPSCY